MPVPQSTPLNGAAAEKSGGSVSLGAGQNRVGRNGDLAQHMGTNGGIPQHPGQSSRRRSAPKQRGRYRLASVSPDSRPYRPKVGLRRGHTRKGTAFPATPRKSPGPDAGTPNPSRGWATPACKDRSRTHPNRRSEDAKVPSRYPSPLDGFAGCPSGLVVIAIIGLVHDGLQIA